MDLGETWALMAKKIVKHMLPGPLSTANVLATDFPK